MNDSAGIFETSLGIKFVDANNHNSSDFNLSNENLQNEDKNLSNKNPLNWNEKANEERTLTATSAIAPKRKLVYVVPDVEKTKSLDGKWTYK